MIRAWNRGCAVVAAAGLLALTNAAPSLAQLHRGPAARQTVLQLAYALGEAHALRRLCAGPSDARWYGQMQRLEARESSDDAFRRQLVESFNAGFASREAEFPSCGEASQAAEREAAARGARLARALAGGEP